MYSSLRSAPGGRPVQYPMMPDAPVRNIILFIGDGMGLAHLSASRINIEGANGWYAIERMPVTSLVRTNSADDIVTESAAGATAYATGHKTKNRMISLSPGLGKTTNDRGSRPRKRTGHRTHHDG